MFSPYPVLAFLENLSPWAAATAMSIIVAGTVIYSLFPAIESRNHRERAHYLKTGEAPERKIPLTNIKYKPKKIPGTNVQFKDLRPLSTREVIEKIRTGELVVAESGEKSQSGSKDESTEKTQSSKEVQASEESQGKKEAVSVPNGEEIPHFVPTDTLTRLRVYVEELKNTLVLREKEIEEREKYASRLSVVESDLSRQVKPFFDLAWESENLAKKTVAGAEQLQKDTDHLKSMVDTLERLTRDDPRCQQVRLEVRKDERAVSLAEFDVKSAVSRYHTQATPRLGITPKEGAQQAPRSLWERTKDLWPGLIQGKRKR